MTCAGRVKRGLRDATLIEYQMWGDAGKAWLQVASMSAGNNGNTKIWEDHSNTC